MFGYLNIILRIGMAHIHLASKELGVKGEWRLEFNESDIRDKFKMPNDARIVGIFDF